MRNDYVGAPMIAELVIRLTLNWSVKLYLTCIGVKRLCG